MLRRTIGLGHVILALCLSLPAAAQNSTGLDYEAFTLDNGLKVILVEDHSAPVVAIDIWYHVGGANDPAGRSGFAHLFEHMMFQGTANLTKDELQSLINDAGGEFNAYTTLDQTAYHQTLPSNQLPLGLWIEADRMASLAVTQTNLDNQRAVVIQEYQQNFGGRAYGLAIRDMTTLPYSYEPYRRSPIGAIDDVNQATVSEMLAFHALYYVPNNATLVIAGDFDREMARDLVDTYFAQIPSGEAPPPLPVWEPFQQAEAQTTTVTDSLIRIPAVMIGYEAPPRQHPDFPAIQVLNSILSVGDSSRLTQNLTDTGEALVASTTLRTNLGPSVFGVILLPNLGVTTREDIEQLYYAELDRILAEGVPQEELDKAINILRSGRIAGLETAFGLAEQVQVANTFYGDPGAVFTEIDRFHAVTSEDIQRVIREYLAPEDRHIVLVDAATAEAFTEPVPFVGATGTPADDAFTVDFALAQTEPPEPLPVVELRLPAITQSYLANGLEVIVVSVPELPVVSLDLIIRGGSSLAPPGQLAVAGAAAGLLTRGTTTRTAQEIVEAIEGRGGATGAYSTGDFLGIGIFALAKDLEFSAGLLADMALNPIFPQEELDVRISQLRSELEAALSNPAAQVGRVFTPMVYPGHPYGEIVTLDAAERMTRQDLVDYYQKVAFPERSILIIGGDVTPEEGLALAEQNFGAWEGVGDPPAITYPPVENDIHGLNIMLVNVPGAQQAEIMLGNLGVIGTDPARYPLSVANNVLGDGLTSRLGRNLREEKGYAYSIASALTFPVDRGLFRVSTRVQPGAVAASITEILNEIGRLQNEPIGEDELASVRGGMVGRFALDLETMQDFVGVVASYRIRGLPISDIAIYPERIGAVNPIVALEVTGTLLPRDLLVVVAGDAAVLQPLLETLGPVTVLEPR